MKHKKILMVVFFLTLFFFQRAQASIGVLSNNKSNSSQPILIQANGLPTQVSVTMLRLNILNGVPLEDQMTKKYIKCLLEDFAYGCTEYYGPSATEFYPYGNKNPVMVDIESAYLPNVLPREMDVVGNPPMLAALQSQALAARSIADWKYRANNGYLDNSTNNQVFVPYSYKYYAPNDTVRQKISDAITSTNGQFLSYNGESVDAEFSNDIANPTRDGTWTDYLVSVQEPISSFCDLSPIETRGNGWGMSQKGAIRWAKGNQCAGNGNQLWPVKWNDYRQILAHYYTGIDILNASGIKIAPDNRWNLIWHNNFGYQTVDMPRLTGGTSYPINLILQNTSSASAPTWSNIELGYQWVTPPFTGVDAQGNPIPTPTDPTKWQVATIGAGTTIPATNSTGQPMTPGQTTAEFTASLVAPPAGAAYTLHLSLRHQGGGWFSAANWPDAQIAAQVIGPAVATFTPTATVIGTPVVISSPTIIPTLTPTPVPFKSLEFFDWNSESV